MATPLSRGFNLGRYDRQLHRPFPSEPRFAPDSEVWRSEHAIAGIKKLAVLGSAERRPAIG
jgi:NAD(P)H dehydrogenase (quinone)